MSKPISYDKLRTEINKLPLPDMVKLIDTYAENNKQDLSKSKHSLILTDFQQRLINNGVNQKCPYCDSSIIVRNGTKNDMIMYKCRECNKNFNLFTNTILEKTRFSWDFWVKLVHMMINHESERNIKYNLIYDFNIPSLDKNTVALCKHKILHGAAMIPMPKLSGVIQVDETFFRETQKGSHKLESYVKNEYRSPRYGYKPSKYGHMGNEFATVVCMVDSNDYVVSKVTGLGKLTKEMFTDMLTQHVKSISFLCTDGNPIYKNVCNLYKIPLYCRRSDYNKVLESNGYRYEKDYPVGIRPVIKEANEKLCAELYKKQLIDYIYNFETLTYAEFKKIKYEKGLNLAKVDGVHRQLKRHLYVNATSVSTKYLEDYVGFETYLRNWRTKHGRLPTTLEDAENILIEILKGKTKYTSKDLKNAKFTLPRVSNQYMELLKQNQKQIRLNKKYKYFKFNEEDGSQSFNMRKFLEDLPAYKLNKLRIKYKIPKKWAKYAVVSELMKQTTLKDDIKEMLIDTHTSLIDEEDQKYIDYWEYKNRFL